MIEPRKALAELAGYTPGRSTAQVQRELGLKEVIKLASNESLWGPSPLAVKKAQSALNEVFRYPEVRPPELILALAQTHGFSPDQIIVGNGADEILRLLGEAYLEPGTSALYPSPSFSAYAFSITLAGAQGSAVATTAEGAMDLDAMAERVTPTTRLLFLCTPNNPTGGIIRQSAWKRFLDHLPDHVLVVVDGAYHEFVDDPLVPDFRTAVKNDPRVVWVRTFSKIYALAGLRIGWAAAAPEVIRALYKVREPFSLNLVGEHAARGALEDVEHFSRVRQETLDARQYLIEELRGRRLKPLPTQANFVTVAVPADGRHIAGALERRGFVVRPTESFGLDAHIRITVAPRPVLQRFLAALDQVLSEIP